MARVLSFDVGVKNLAYCLIDHDTSAPLVEGAVFPDSMLSQFSEGQRGRAEVVDWRVVVASDKKRPTIAEIADGVNARCDEIHEAHGLPDVVLIESQPCMRNPTMKSVQMIIYCHFVMRARLSTPAAPCRVLFVNAGLKLTGLLTVAGTVAGTVAVKGAKDYRTRKRASVMAAGSWLGRFAPGVTKKKDDLADSLLQALQWLRREYS